MPVSRMRTIDGALELLKQEDAGCQLTRWALRNLVITGQVPSVVVGKSKRLINVDVLKSYLAGELDERIEPVFTNGIRRIG